MKEMTEMTLAVICWSSQAHSNLRDLPSLSEAIPNQLV